MNPVAIIRALREGGHVRRCHTLPHHGHYDVAQHSWHAVSLLYVLYGERPPARLIWALMFHDVAERYFGDQPAQAGWSDPQLRALQKANEAKVLETLGLLTEPLNPTDVCWVEAIDKLELWLWCLDQKALGNLHVENCKQLLLKWFQENSQTIPAPVLRFLDGYDWKRGAEQLPPT